MKFTSLADLSVPTIPSSNKHLALDGNGDPIQPKFHVDILTFGDELGLLDYMLIKLDKRFPGAITNRQFKSDGPGWRLEIQILYGRATEYVKFLEENNLLDRSLRLGYEESRAITRNEPRKRRVTLSL